ncbi:hypothetical protein [Rhodopseudomonas palustris]|uniref:Uncharacterized protein n=1 Tax=Rhodopseudomonas palustris TaxID=1076 RepID=A0A418V162_RHOPL|nr:hypothetical protein [Rhodopseudomonas palustris]RJF69593.1 hypothetical protein D4Q52_19755 [Rhodopseudomonas palustris]
MQKHDRIELLLGNFRREAADLVDRTAVELKAILSSPEIVPRDPWLVVKDAARRVGKSEKVVWSLAQRTPGASWMHGGRRMVNIDRLPIEVPPGS